MKPTCKRYLTRVTALLLCGLALSCQTFSTSKTKPHPQPRETGEFRPATFVSPIHRQEGRYPGLLGDGSYAVWIGPEVASFKRGQAVAQGESVDPELGEEADYLTANYIIIECHLESVFADMSIAYDVVGLRGLDLFLETPDGGRIAPIQTVIASSLEEEQRNALKLFRRTTLAVFSKQDVWLDAPAIAPQAAAVRLVLTGQDSTFYFEWPGASAADGVAWVPKGEEAARALRMKFSDVFGRIRELVHIFD